MGWDRARRGRSGQRGHRAGPIRYAMPPTKPPTGAPGRRPKLLAVLLACALLLACSTVKLAYNNLPGLGYWWLDGYLDLNAAQGPRLRDELADLLAWHRRNELPHLTRLLGRAQAMAPLDLQPNDACALVEEIEARLLAVARQAEPAAAEIALSLDQTQLVQLERKYSEVNATYRKDWLALRPPARVGKRYQQFLERGEDFYGPLDEAQQELLRRQVTQSVFNPEFVDVERRRRQQELLTVLRRLLAAPSSPPEARTALHDLVTGIAQPAPGLWREHRQLLQAEGCRDIAALHNSTTAAQRERAVRRLRAYEDDLRALADGG